MKKTLVCGFLFLFSAALIVRPGIRSVNIPASEAVATTGTLSAEGDPMPNPRGPHASSLLVSEGDPMPNPRGPHSSALLVAEGDPMPNPRGPHASSVLVAE